MASPITWKNVSTQGVSDALKVYQQSLNDSELAPKFAKFSQGVDDVIQDSIDQDQLEYEKKLYSEIDPDKTWAENKEKLNNINPSPDQDWINPYSQNAMKFKKMVRNSGTQIGQQQYESEYERLLREGKIEEAEALSKTQKSWINRSSQNVLNARNKNDKLVQTQFNNDFMAMVRRGITMEELQEFINKQPHTINTSNEQLKKELSNHLHNQKNTFGFNDPRTQLAAEILKRFGGSLGKEWGQSRQNSIRLKAFTSVNDIESFTPTMNYLSEQGIAINKDSLEYQLMISKLIQQGINDYNSIVPNIDIESIKNSIGYDQRKNDIEADDKLSESQKLMRKQQLQAELSNKIVNSRYKSIGDQKQEIVDKYANAGISLFTDSNGKPITALGQRPAGQPPADNSKNDPKIGMESFDKYMADENIEQALSIFQSAQNTFRQINLSDNIPNKDQQLSRIGASINVMTGKLEGYYKQVIQNKLDAHVYEAQRNKIDNLGFYGLHKLHNNIKNINPSTASTPSARSMQIGQGIKKGKRLSEQNKEFNQDDLADAVYLNQTFGAYYLPSLKEDIENDKYDQEAQSMFNRLKFNDTFMSAFDYLNLTDDAVYDPNSVAGKAAKQLLLIQIANGLSNSQMNTFMQQLDLDDVGLMSAIPYFGGAESTDMQGLFDFMYNTTVNGGSVLKILQLSREYNEGSLWLSDPDIVKIERKGEQDLYILKHNATIRVPLKDLIKQGLQVI